MHNVSARARRRKVSVSLVSSTLNAVCATRLRRGVSPKRYGNGGVQAPVVPHIARAATAQMAKRRSTSPDLSCSRHWAAWPGGSDSAATRFDLVRRCEPVDIVVP